VRPSRLREAAELLSLSTQALDERGQRGPKLAEGEQHRHLGGGRVGVVRRLSPVDVVVRADLVVRSARLPRELEGPVREHLVDVHVRARPGPGLEDVHDELVVEPTARHLLSGLGDPPAALGVEASLLDVRPAARELEERIRPDQVLRRPEAAHGEVLAGPQGLDAPVRGVGNFTRPERILLRAGWRHGETMRRARQNV
jgi:hypothetical protein